jgi:multiple sugar transport system substrate-binding protein
MISDGSLLTVFPNQVYTVNVSKEYLGREIPFVKEHLDMSKRFVIAVLSLIVVLSLGSGMAVQAQDQVTVKLWMHLHPPRIAIDKELIAKFEAANPGIKVDANIEIPVPDFDSKMATGLASGAGPDLFNDWTGSIGQTFASGINAPVDPAAIGVKDQDAIYAMYGEGELGQNLLAGATFNNTLYGLPTELSIYGCFTNNALWKKAGLDPNKDFPATWEDLLTVAEKLTVRDAKGAPTQRGFDFNWAAPLFMYLQFGAQVAQLGGTMIDEVSYKAAFDTPEVRRVMAYWNDFVNVKKLGGPQYQFSRDSFWAGQMAIECTQGNWAVPELAKNKIEWTLHPIPRWKTGNKVDSGYSTYAYFFQVASYSPPKVQAAAWKLAAFLTSQPGRYLNEAGLFQPVASYIASDAFKNSDQGKLMPFFLEQMGKTPYHPRIAGFNAVADALARARDRVLGGESMDTVMPAAQTELNDILARALQDAQAAKK